MGAVYREELSANARKLIEELLSLPQGWVTAAALAESIGVSRRTVLRELPAVEQWMQAAGAHFVRNPGKGLLLDEAPERRDALRTQLNSGDRKELSRAERRQQLLTRLLSEQEPCKTAVLARALGVSESTLSADLDELETKLHPYRVEMFRRPGVGVWLQGDASSYRRVVSALLRSSMPEKELAEVLCGRMPENEIFSTLLDTKTAEKVWAALQQFEQEEQLHLPDAGFLALAIHCTLTIQQLRQGGDKGSAPRGLRPAGNHAARLVAALNRAFGLTLPSEEAQYLELYLSAYLGAEDPWGSAQEMELRNLEAALIREMEKALHTDLSGYTSLRDDLYCHLRPMLLRVLRCRNVRVQNLRLLNAAAWTTAFLDSDFIWATDLHIENHRNYNGDGLDFDGCRHVWVRGCYIDGTDDNLCLQSSGLPVQDVHISDCAFTSVCAGIRIGLKSIGEISGVVISNCTMRNIWREGIKLECTEGGSITDILAENVTMHNVRRPIFAILNNRYRPDDLGSSVELDHIPPIGTMARLRFVGITAVDDEEMTHAQRRFDNDIMGEPRFGGCRFEANHARRALPGGPRPPASSHHPRQRELLSKLEPHHPFRCPLCAGAYAGKSALHHFAL